LSLLATIALGTWPPLRAAFALLAARPGFALKPASQVQKVGGRGKPLDISLAELADLWDACLEHLRHNS
jgi:hypothetical protein